MSGIAGDRPSPHMMGVFVSEFIMSAKGDAALAAVEFGTYFGGVLGGARVRIVSPAVIARGDATEVSERLLEKVKETLKVARGGDVVAIAPIRSTLSVGTPELPPTLLGYLVIEADHEPAKEYVRQIEDEYLLKVAACLRGIVQEV